MASTLPSVTVAAPPSKRWTVPCDQIALLGGVFVEDGVALLLAETLDNNLLGGLGGDAAEQLRLDGLLAVLDLNGTVVAINDDADVINLNLVAAEVLLGGEVDGRLDGGEDGLRGILRSRWTMST